MHIKGAGAIQSLYFWTREIGQFSGLHIIMETKANTVSNIFISTT